MALTLAETLTGLAVHLMYPFLHGHIVGLYFPASVAVRYDHLADSGQWLWVKMMCFTSELRRQNFPRTLLLSLLCQLDVGTPGHQVLKIAEALQPASLTDHTEHGCYPFWPMPIGLYMSKKRKLLMYETTKIPRLIITAAFVTLTNADSFHCQPNGNFGFCFCFVSVVFRKSSLFLLTRLIFQKFVFFFCFLSQHLRSTLK